MLIICLIHLTLIHTSRIRRSFPSVQVGTNEEKYFGTLYTQFGTCGGVFVTISWFMTAAHCLDSATVSDLRNLYVALDEPSNERALEFFNVSRYARYPNSTYATDIALIELHCLPGSACPPHNRIKPIVLPSPHSDEPYIDSDAKVKVISSGSYGDFAGKRKAEINLHHQDCYYSAFYRFDFNRQLCYPRRFQSNDIAFCDSDSGSPAVTLDGTNLLLGIICFKTYLCEQLNELPEEHYKMTVFLRITSFMPWITETLLTRSNNDTTDFSTNLANAVQAWGGKSKIH